MTAPTLSPSCVPLSSVSVRSLVQASKFFADELISERSRVWRSPVDRKDYSAPRNGRDAATWKDVYRHLAGEHVAAVSRLRNCLVIDYDLHDRLPSDDEKEDACEKISLLLDSFGIPHAHLDGPGGTHTWIRMSRDGSRKEKEALKQLCDSLGLPGSFDIFPKGGGIKLPLGHDRGCERNTLPEPSTDAQLLQWLIYPPKATDEQLSALVAAALKRENGPAVHPEPPKPAERLTEAPRIIGAPTAAAPVEPKTGPPAPITGWERWPECKRQLATQGPLPARRNSSIFTLACEAVENGERSLERIVAFLAAVPRPHSRTPKKEHLAECRIAARDALALKAAGSPERLSGCPAIPNHSGHPATSEHRQNIAHLCAEFADSCPIHHRWEKAQNIPAYQHIILSSIWRDGRGQYGLGLGQKAKEIYKLLLSMSGGDPEKEISASTRYIAIKLPNVVKRNSVPTIRERLVEIGLIERVEGKEDASTFRVPFRPPSWIAQLEADLGTDKAASREREAILREWQEYERFRKKNAA